MTAPPVAEQRLIPIMLIDVVDRLRPVDPDWVEVIAASMAERGQDQPIVVRPDGENRFRLVVGAHRLDGAWRLEWPAIRCEVRNLSDAEARLAEIDENLARRELGPLDRALFLSERKRVWEALHPDTQHGGDRRSGGIKSQRLRLDRGLPTPERFSKSAARKTGLSERAVQLALELGSGLVPEAIAVMRGTRLAENASALLRIAREAPADQVVLANLLASRQARTLDHARALAGLPAPVKRRRIEAPEARAAREDRLYTTVSAIIEEASPAFRARVADFLVLLAEVGE